MGLGRVGVGESGYASHEAASRRGSHVPGRTGMVGSEGSIDGAGVGLDGSTYVFTMQPTGCGRSNGYKSKRGE